MSTTNKYLAVNPLGGSTFSTPDPRCELTRREFLYLASCGGIALGGCENASGQASQKDLNTTSAIPHAKFRLGGDLVVNRLGLGAMRLPSVSGMGGPPRNPEGSRATLRRAVELGVNLIDTADFYYCAGGTLQANTLIREALHPYQAGLVIATKVGPNVDSSGRPATPLYGPASDLRTYVERNLKDLRLDRLDLVYLRVGLMTPPHGEPIDERFEALAKLRQEGKIRHLGLSNVDAAHLKAAQAIAPVAAVENYFNIIKRDDAAMVDICTTKGIAFVPFGPLGSGGRENLHMNRVTRVAARHEASVYQIALAWLLARSPIILPIPGTGRVDHLEENVSARSIILTKEDLADLA